MATQEELLQRLAQLEAENERLKAGARKGVSMKVSEKGGLSVVGLAVAVVVGAAFGAVVTAFVKDLLTPLIAAVGGQPDFAALDFTVNGSRFAYGEFINAVIAFLIVAAVVYYLVVLPYTKLR